MTDHQPISPPLPPDLRFGRHLAATAISSSEREAIYAGVRAGEAALAQSGASGVLTLFMEVGRSQIATPRLQALRTYAELRRVMLLRGHEVPATSLVAAGFTAAEIAEIDRMIKAIPSETESSRYTSGCAGAGR